jgi:transposase
MTKESKLILGLKGDLSSKFYKKYTEEEKHFIINKYLSSTSSKREIWHKYTGYEIEHGQITRWMRQLGYLDKLKNATFALKNTTMQNRKRMEKQTVESVENLQLNKKIEELEKQLKDAEMKAVAFSTMVDIAEKEFNIPIRKKFNTKPSK